MIPSFSACTATMRPSRRGARHALVQVRSSAAVKSSMPLADMKALKPTTPRLGKLIHMRNVAGHQAAPQREVRDRRGFAPPRPLSRSSRTSMVGGWALSGISITSSRHRPPVPASLWRSLPTRFALVR